MTQCGLGYLRNDDVLTSRKSEPSGLREEVVTDKQIIIGSMGDQMAWVVQHQHEQSGVHGQTS